MCGVHAAVGGLFATGDPGPDTVVFYDLEASLEHMARGTPKSADLMLAVTEPYYRSLETTARLADLAGRLPIPRFAVVANKVRSLHEAEAVQDFCRRHDLQLLASIPYDANVVAADDLGQALLDMAPHSPAVESVANLLWSLREKVH